MSTIDAAKAVVQLIDPNLVVIDKDYLETIEANLRKELAKQYKDEIFKTGRIAVSISNSNPLRVINPHSNARLKIIELELTHRDLY